MLLARAKRLDNGEWVEGYYFYEGRHWIVWMGKDFEEDAEIDPSTLKYKVGDKWLTEDEIIAKINLTVTKSGVIEVLNEMVLQSQAKCKPKSCESCDRWRRVNENFGECFINGDLWSRDEFCTKHEPKDTK